VWIEHKKNNKKHGDQAVPCFFTKGIVPLISLEKNIKKQKQTKQKNERIPHVSTESRTPLPVFLC
jgi:hypothetical protein